MGTHGPGDPLLWVSPLGVTTFTAGPSPAAAGFGGGFSGGFSGGFGGGFGSSFASSGYAVTPPALETSPLSKSRAIVIKKIETRDGKLVSESSDVLAS